MMWNNLLRPIIPLAPLLFILSLNSFTKDAGSTLALLVG